MRAVICLAGVLGCFGLESGLLTKAELARRPKVTRLADYSKMPLPVRTADLSLTAGPPYLVTGRGWRVELPDAARGAWKGDGGSYYFTAYSGGAGFAPATWMMAIRFDENGMPVPFVCYTHGSIDDVVDLDGRGAQMLVQEYWGSMWSDPGHYVTTLYETRGPYWYRADGRHGAHVFPAFERWSVRAPNDRPVLVAPLQKAVRDLSNDPAQGVALPVAGCRSLFVNVEVEDGPNGRRIAPGRDGNYAGREGVVTGLERREKGSCVAAVYWRIGKVK